MTKSGSDHIRSLRDGREIYLDGEQVGDVTCHMAYRNAVKSSAALYDYQSQPENLESMTFESPTSGDRVSRLWQLPRNFRELTQRREALTSWAELTCGMMGRSPDHVGSSLAGMMMGIDVFRAYDAKRAGALEDYFASARDQDHFISYVIINPQADRSKSAGKQPDEYLVAGICDEDSQGITIKGAKMLGTGVVMANELLVSGFQSLQPGEEKYAFTACIPVNSKGLKMMSRRSYEAHAGSGYDYPLASRFDENDAVVYFDEVKIPWERVFVHRDVKMAQAQWIDTRAHVFQNYQCQIRFVVKLRFLLALARRISEVNGIVNFPQVRETLGLLAAKAGMMEGLLRGMESAGEMIGGYFVPNARLLSSAQVMSQEIYPEFVLAIRQLAGGGLIMLPSSVRDFENEETRRMIDKTQRSAIASPEERVKLFKLAWDALGSEFGSRHVQYEMFYSGPTFVTRGHAYRNYDWGAIDQQLSHFMSSYSLEETLAHRAGNGV